MSPRLPFRYVGRFVLANGDPRAFHCSAWNKAEAAALIWNMAREVLADEFSGSLFFGVERVYNQRRAPELRGFNNRHED